MKFRAMHLSLCLLLVLAAGTMVLGKTKHDVTFTSDVMVNGTTVKAGTYDLKYDDKTATLEVLKGSKVVASAPVHLEPLPGQEHRTKINLANNQLVSVVFAGENQAVVISSSAPQTGSE
jgi:hypothetical protein